MRRRVCSPKRHAGNRARIFVGVNQAGVSFAIDLIAIPVDSNFFPSQVPPVVPLKSVPLETANTSSKKSGPYRRSMEFRDAASMDPSFQWSPSFELFSGCQLIAGKIFAGIQMGRCESFDIFQRLRLRRSVLF